MRIEFHNKLKKPLAAQATRLLVTAEDGTPILLVIERNPRQWFITRAGDPDFEAQLGYYGIKKSVIVVPHDFTSKSGNILTTDSETNKH